MIDRAEPFDAFAPLRCGRGNAVVVYASGLQRFVFGQHRAVQVRLQQLMPWIARIIRLRVGEDEQLGDELFQQAKLELVLVDPSRLVPTEERWLKRRIAAAVKRLWWHEVRFRNRVMSVELDAIKLAGEPGNPSGCNPGTFAPRPPGAETR